MICTYSMFRFSFFIFLVTFPMYLWPSIIRPSRSVWRTRAHKPNGVRERTKDWIEGRKRSNGQIPRGKTHSTRTKVYIYVISDIPRNLRSGSKESYTYSRDFRSFNQFLSFDNYQSSSRSLSWVQRNEDELLKKV